MIFKVNSEIGKLLIFASFICLAQCLNILAFHSYNLCGCHSDYYCDICEPCSSYHPKCNSSNLVFEAFEPVNIENCSQWYLDGHNVTLQNKNDGSVIVTLLLSPSWPLKINMKYKVDLNVLDPPGINSTQTVTLPNHSSKYVKVRETTTCQSVVSLEFKYLYSATYQLEITAGKEFSSSMKCRSKLFEISSNYEKRKINKLQPSYLSRYRPQTHSLVTSFLGGGLNLSEKLHIEVCDISHSIAFENGCNCSVVDIEDSIKAVVLDLSAITVCPIFFRQELILDSKFGNFSAGHHPVATVVVLRSHIDLSLSDCAGSGNEVAKYILNGEDGMCCDCYDANDTQRLCNGQSVCPCQWDSSVQNLKCTFLNVTNGDYCIVVEFYDPRCASDTIWTKDGGCAWSFNETAKGNNSSAVYSVLLDETSPHWPIFLFIVCIIVIVTGSYVVFKHKTRCFKKLNHGIHNYVPTRNQPSETPVSPWFISREEYKKLPEVLLLYPRDCEPFMNAMATMRAYLRNNNFTIYDPWDDEIYDEVVESCETWSLQFIKNDSVKIIIVLTECSKNFENAFLQNSILGYSEPQPRDSIFPQSFSTIHQFFAKRFDSYQRLFVVRFDGSPITNFEFITPNKIYSIPTNIGLLISDLTSGDLKDSNYLKLLKLRNATVEYESYIKTNSDYLTELLCPKKINQS